MSASRVPGQSEVDGALEQLEVCVEDSGIGIAPESLTRIFMPFEQLENPYRKEFEGTGLGLALCKRIIEAHKGEIWAESDLGEGSRFIFRLALQGPKLPEYDI